MKTEHSFSLVTTNICKLLSIGVPIALIVLFFDIFFLWLTHTLYV